MARRPTIVIDKLPLGQSSALTDCAAVAIGPGGHLDIEVDIHNGAGAVPTDAPVGTWQLLTSSGVGNAAVDDSASYKPVDILALTTALAALAPNGNQVVGKTISLRGLQGRFAKMRYVRSTGGSATATGTASRARVVLTVDDA